MFRENNKHIQMQLLTTVDSLPQAQSKRLDESWAGVFYRECFSRIDERPFAVLYSHKDSRPNIPVNVVVALEALKAGFGWSDEEMYDAFCFDLQVRYALGYRNLADGAFDLRIRGLFRVSTVLIGCATMANVRRIHRYIIGKPAGKAEAGAECAIKTAFHTWASSCVGLVARLVDHFGSHFGCNHRDAYALV